MKSKIETSGVQHAENAMGNNVFYTRKKSASNTFT